MRGDAGIIDRIQRYSPADLSLSAITLAEILYGIEKSPVKKKKRQEKIRQISSLLDLYSFDEAAAGEYALIRSQLEREGLAISEMGIDHWKISLGYGIVQLIIGLAVLSLRPFGFLSIFILLSAIFIALIWANYAARTKLPT